MQSFPLPATVLPILLNGTLTKKQCCSDEHKKQEEARIEAAKQEVEKAEATMNSMLVLMANLAESPIMQSSPSASHLLTIPLNEEDQETNAAWKTAENFLDSVKVSNASHVSWCMGSSTFECTAVHIEIGGCLVCSHT